MSEGADSANARVGGPAVSEAALVTRLRQGDEPAFEELVRMHGSRLLGVARRFMPNEDDARDVVQETLISAFRALKNFKGESRLSTWLHRIAVNTALMKLRTGRRRPEDPIDPLLPGFQADGHHQESFRSWVEPVDEAMQRAEQRALVRRSIAQLPDSYRTVLLLRDIEELDTQEVAAAMGISPNAVKIRLHRARQALRTLLDPHFRGV